MDATGLPAGSLLRPPRGDEASVVARLSAAADGAVGAPPALGEVLVRRMWARPRFELETDAWIVEMEGAVVGYAQVWASEPSRLSAYALVHPDHTGRGIGSALAELVERRGAEQAAGEARLFTAVTPEDEGAARLLTQRGYAWARRFWHMEAELDGPPEPAVSPPGVAVRTLDPERDLPDAHRILEEAFVDHWDTSPTSYEEFLDQNVHLEDFDPGLWFVAADGDAPVGVLTGSAHGDRGAVDLLGVLRSHRGRGIASALLGAAFIEFRRREVRYARLGVDSDNLTGAVSLYERMGMRVVASFDLWTRTIRGVHG
jgi:mycothiol synthase